MELWEHSALEVATLVRNRAVSAREICEAALARIDAVNPAINAVVQDCSADARAAADLIDNALADGKDPGPLAGVPITIKVNVDQAGYATTNGIRIQKDLVADRDNPVVDNLKRAGAVVVGRTNTPAFSLRWFCRNLLHGATYNPRNRKLTPGGSSGGAAAGLATGIGAIAHGTDIGGSVRYPAYACGVHGLRPSLGRIAAFNATSGDRLIGGQLMAVSGPLARSIPDLRLALEAMSHGDVDDPWWSPVPLAGGGFPRRAAVCTAPEGMVVASEVQQALTDAAKKLRDAGWEVDEAEPPSFAEAAQIQALFWLAEFRRTGAAAVAEEGDPDAIFVLEQMQRLCPSPSLDDFMDALKDRARQCRAWAKFLTQYSVLICPVSGELPFKDHDDVTSPEAFERILRAQLTQVGLPLVGLPGLTVTTGQIGTTPVGVQLIAGRFREDILLAAGGEIADRSPAVTVIDPATE